MAFWIRNRIFSSQDGSRHPGSRIRAEWRYVLRQLKKRDLKILAFARLEVLMCKHLMEHLRRVNQTKRACRARRRLPPRRAAKSLVCSRIHMRRRNVPAEK